MMYQILNELKASGLPSEIDRLIVGLGNPGKRYEKTRHNIGFMVLDSAFPQYYKEPWKASKRIPAEWCSTKIGKETVLLVKPQTYMNLSGEAVAPLMKALNLKPEQLIVVVDEVALPYGKVRVRAKGSAGGQNGMKSVIKALGSRDDFPRIRLGIGPQPDKLPLEAFVLQAFSSEEQQQLPAVLRLANQALTICLLEGVHAASGQINGLNTFQPES